MIKLHHPYCEISRCTVCYADAMALMERLNKDTGVDTIDHLAHYRTFLEKKTGRCMVTEYGWFEPEVFDEENIQAYVDSMT